MSDWPVPDFCCLTFSVKSAESGRPYLDDLTSLKVIGGADAGEKVWEGPQLPDAEGIAEFTEGLPLVCDDLNGGADALRGVLLASTRPQTVYPLQDILLLSHPLLRSWEPMLLAEFFGINPGIGETRVLMELFLRAQIRFQEFESGFVEKLLASFRRRTTPAATFVKTVADFNIAHSSPLQPRESWDVLSPFSKLRSWQFQEEEEREFGPVEQGASAKLLSRGGGAADRIEGFELRPQQLEMATMIEDLWNKGGRLVVEAGTGVGKSLAYLVPSALFALKNETRVVISTYTRTLQGQLQEKDLASLAEVPELRGLKVRILKGKGNYLCVKRFRQFLDDDLTEDDIELAAFLIAWTRASQEHDLEEISGYPSTRFASLPRHRTRLSAAGEICKRKLCPLYDRCVVRRARAWADEAHLVLVNHALLFIDLKLKLEGGQGPVIPPFNHLVLDEAHNALSSATDHLADAFDTRTVLDRLAALVPGKRQGVTGYLSDILSVRLPEEVDRMGIVETRAAETAEILEEFTELALELAPSENSSLLAAGALLEDEKYLELKAVWEEMSGKAGELLEALGHVEELFEDLDDALAEDEVGRIADLAAHSSELDFQFLVLRWFFLRERPGEAYFFEFPGRDKDRARLKIAPLSVDGPVGDFLNSKRGAVLTSATLSVAGDFNFACRSLGIDPEAEDTRTAALGSPFDFQSQAALLIPNDSPDPSRGRGEQYVRELSECLREVLVNAGGGTLVLFTSRRDMRFAAELLRPELTLRGLNLLCQDVDGGRGWLLDTLKRDLSTVLFGVRSFWEGIDVRGEGLTCLVLVRLPFEPPDDPVTRARLDLMEERGDDAFFNWTVPQAVIRFRQGFGRLIRSHQDKGVVVVMDRRIISKGYGARFRASLPEMPVYRGSSERIGRMVARILRGEGGGEG